MIIITGSATIAPQQIEQALALGIAHSSRSRSEPGCLAHNCHTDAEDPQRIVFVEEWANMAAVKTHFAVPDSGKFVRDLSKMAEGPPVMTIFRDEPVPPQS
ncbi:putative quinol monooxygenase [Novosphingobium sp.]|uniref:putative quinol monooxygenase n=1 Tax=Novosphingobium sp. TaxID=1874826 RepID=UPI00286A1ABA|nr:putative quinol monooxygenase [Novosphingobium sp.]